MLLLGSGHPTSKYFLGSMPPTYTEPSLHGHSRMTFIEREHVRAELRVILGTQKKHFLPCLPAVGVWGEVLAEGGKIDPKPGVWQGNPETHALTSWGTGELWHSHLMLSIGILVWKSRSSLPHS